MSTKHHYRLDQSFHQKHFLILFAAIIIGALLTAGGVITWQNIRDRQKAGLTGIVRPNNQSPSDVMQRLTVSEPLFSLQLPSDWEEVKRTNNTSENSITWQATKENEESRWLTLHIDIIPNNRAVNRLLPVQAEGNMLRYGELSDNCATFTESSTLDAHPPEMLTSWQKADFICNLPRVIDNEIGTGSTEGINTVTVTGPVQGPHRYFFLYTDRNVQPETAVLLDTIRSFRAK